MIKKKISYTKPSISNLEIEYAICAATRISDGLPELEWLVENRIPKNDLLIIGGKPKVGKS